MGQKGSTPDMDYRMELVGRDKDPIRHIVREAGRIKEATDGKVEVDGEADGEVVEWSGEQKTVKALVTLMKPNKNGLSQK